MKKYSFNDNWNCYKTGNEKNKFIVTLPHDAMQLDEKSEYSAGGGNTGWYEANDYTYEKSFFLPKEYRNQNIIFEFEGVYRKTTIFINEKLVASHTYGYTGFFVEAKDALVYEKENIIRVEVINHDQPNSRWYSGTGIYRPVWMYVLPEKHIKLEGIRVSTIDYKNPKIKVDATTTGEGIIKIEVLDGEKVIAEVEGISDGTFSKEIHLPKAKLWNEASPYLYNCRVTFLEDVQEERFGIRTITCTPEEGFCINGKRVILRGACIHHDNGLLGARAYDYSEKRKIRILQENGYNAVRSAHNPCSKAMLRACDELGMLMVDEYVDVWYIHKTKYDYATEVEANYREDLAAIVSKDYNHPSVIMYSTGNEVSETAYKKGIELCGNLTKRLHELDPSRPVTCGVNIFFNFLSSVGFGVYSDHKADTAAKNAKKKKAVGSEFFNNLAGILGDEFMKRGATLYPCDIKTRDSFAQMDVAGYNYGIYRYEHDLKKYPDRLILGSETFCNDAYKFWEVAKENKRIVGDFVWAGMDYLGEVGIGSWEYETYAPSFDKGPGWVSAGSGRIDLTGKALSEMNYTQVAFEQRDIAIGVIPVPYTKQKHSPSAWKMTNAVESWSWNGYDGMEAKVEVYCRAHTVSLYVNQVCVGTKKTKNDCKVTFLTKYQKGEVKAVGFDANGKKIAETFLKTAEESTRLTLEPEAKTISLNNELSYIRLKYTDENGLVKPLIRSEIKLQVEGGELLGLGSACPYYPMGYLGESTDTYYGEALAIIKPTAVGEMKVSGTSLFGNCEVNIKVVY